MLLCCKNKKRQGPTQRYNYGQRPGAGHAIQIPFQKINYRLYTAVFQENFTLDPEREHEEIEGAEQVDKVIEIDQAPIGRTPRSNNFPTVSSR